MNYPYNMSTTDVLIMEAIKAVRLSYGPIPETTCGHSIACCLAGCPNMYYAEYLSIREAVIDKMEKSKRKNFLIECIRRYLQIQSVSSPKSCAFIGSDRNCSIYSYRPLKCRLYGLIPNDLYERNVDAVSKDMRVSKEKIPLCKQCNKVKIKPGYEDKFPDGKIAEEMIVSLEKALRENDVAMGLPKKMQDDGFGFLAIHDWHVMSELGENWMASLTSLRVGMSDEQKEDFLRILKSKLSEDLE